METIKLESALFTDPEQARPTGFCPDCGGEIYDGGEKCSFCREERE